jgi:hypothetical protein
MSKLTPAQKKKHKEALEKFNSNPNKPTSAGVPRPSRNLLNSVGKKLSSLSGPAIDLIGKALLGELVPEKSVWKGSDQDKADLLLKNPGIRFEVIEFEPGIEVEVMIEWVKVPESKITTAKWVITQDAAFKKSVEESRLRKLEAALKHKKAVDDGALPTDDEQMQEEARNFGGPRKLDLDGFSEDGDD